MIEQNRKVADALAKWLNEPESGWIMWGHGHAESVGARQLDRTGGGGGVWRVRLAGSPSPGDKLMNSSAWVMNNIYIYNLVDNIESKNIERNYYF
jgi:hypothetical protein